eukprot:5414992-Karenia_brevis.AAC.1
MWAQAEPILAQAGEGTKGDMCPAIKSIKGESYGVPAVGTYGEYHCGWRRDVWTKGSQQGHLPSFKSNS